MATTRTAATATRIFGSSRRRRGSGAARLGSAAGGVSVISSLSCATSNCTRTREDARRLGTAAPGTRRYAAGMTRAEEAAQRAALAAARDHAESQAAQQLIDGFLVQARERGLAPEPLRATLYSGQSVRTDKTGWYLRKNRSLAIGEDGSYYVLTIPG